MSSARGPRRSCGDGRSRRGCPEGARREHGCWKKLGFFGGAGARRGASTLQQLYGDARRLLAQLNVSVWPQRRRGKVVERQKRASGRVALARCRIGILRLALICATTSPLDRSILLNRPSLALPSFGSKRAQLQSECSAVQPSCPGALMSALPSRRCWISATFPRAATRARPW